jgi:hypothetical protein
MSRHVVSIPGDADKGERGFLEALQRVVDRTPESEICKDLLAKGELKVCQWHVVWEAGRNSRTTISGKPRVQAAIALARKAERNPSLSAPEAAMLEADERLRAERATTRSLREQLRATRREADAAYTRQGAVMLLIQELGATKALGGRSKEERDAARRAAEERVPLS